MIKSNSKAETILAHLLPIRFVSMNLFGSVLGQEWCDRHKVQLSHLLELRHSPVHINI